MPYSLHASRPAQLAFPRLSRQVRYVAPTMELGTARGVLQHHAPGITEDQVRELIERGAFWAWNVAEDPKGKHPELRLLTCSVAALCTGRASLAERAESALSDLLDDPYTLAKPVPATAEEAVDALMHHATRTTQQGKPHPLITGAQVKLLLCIRRTHLITLVASNALPKAPGTDYRPGPNGFPLIRREDLQAFLEARLVC